MTALGVEVGEMVSFSKTIGESDVLLFAGITGDFARHHIDEAFMSESPFGGRIAHGVLILGLASTTSTAIADRIGRQTVSYGYDKVRFTAPVRIGDTITIDYTIASIDVAAGRIRSDIRGYRQDGQLCLAAAHILAVVEDPPNGPAR
jgi:3-hydroxybutyryl-CoA dehydratase